MANYIRIAHYQQSADGYCLPACVRMVLANLGIQKREKELSRIFDTQSHGTPASRVTRLTSINVAVDYHTREISKLPQILADNTPIIAPVRTRDLGYWEIDVAHAVVIVGLELERFFWIHDPHLATGPVQVLWNGLLAGWVEYDYKGATIRR